MNLDAENLTAEVDQETQTLRIEPQYVEYLREHNYTIESLNEVHAVKSESDPESGYLVVSITTYEKPKDSPKLDAVADEMDLWVCSCWSYRTNSNDVSEGITKPGGSCKHVRAVSKTEKAKADEAQSEL